MKKKAVWGKLQSLTDGIPSIPLSEDETVVGRRDVGGTNMTISSRHFKKSSGAEGPRKGRMMMMMTKKEEERKRRSSTSL